MKRFICGVLVFLFGAALTIITYIDALAHPTSRDGRIGVFINMGSQGTQFAFILSCAILISGAALCWYEAYWRK